MRGTVMFARAAGAVALGGAFYTATYITSYPRGAPAYAVLGLLAGTAAGMIALVASRSVAALTIAAVLLGFAFTGAVIDSGAGFAPGLVLMILAARRAARPGDFAFLEERTEPQRAVAGGDGFRRTRPPATAPVVMVPEAEDVITVPEAEAAPRVSSDGQVQAGPPGIIGLLGPSGGRPPRGFGRPTTG